jgi:hypothetical protein
MRPQRRPPRVGLRTNIHEEPEGWSVRVTRGGRDHADYFGNAVWGGRGRALLAAQHWRDRLLLRIDPDIRVRRKPATGRRHSTGVEGVSRETHRVGGRIYCRYIAGWRDPEKGWQRRRFLVQRYGKEQAFALAKRARRSGVKRSKAYMKARQREEAVLRLRKASAMPRPVKDPRSRRGISMARRRPRRKR